MRPQRILIVDDESSLRTSLFRVLDRQGFVVLTANCIKEAQMLAAVDQPIDLALIDLRLPDGDGLDLMAQIKRSHPLSQSIIFTGFGSIDLAVQAVQRGAFHFMTKPFSVDEITSIVSKAISQKELERENSQLRTELRSKYRFKNIVGDSPEIRSVLEMVERVSGSDSTVLITGESGTGKELVAKAIHYNSTRANKPFVPINCGAIPSELLESELFGHVKGAFTGAISNRIGRFEMSENGTLFLDEIGDMSTTLQVKMLRVLQDRRFEPVGSTKTIEANVRIVAATNINLERAVEEHRFREDLYYRLNVIPICIPSLRQRRSDIPLLLNHFLEVFNRHRERHISGFTNPAVELLTQYSWPGNIRELENLVERLTILKGQGAIDVDDLPEKYRSRKLSLADAQLLPPQGMDFNSAVDAFENSLLLQALEKTGWNRNQAANLLRLNRTTLVEKLKKKGLQQPNC